MEYYQNSYPHGNHQTHNVVLPTHAGQPLPPIPEEQPPKVSSLARRIHGWSWQAVSHLSSCTWRAARLTMRAVSDWYGHRGGVRHPVRAEGALEHLDPCRNVLLLPEHRSLCPERDDSDNTACW